MTFSWSEYLWVAKQWADEDLDEAHWRSAVSRAYYASYHCAKRHVDPWDLEIIIMEKASHREVWDWLRARRRLKQAALTGSSLLKARTDADYNQERTFFPNDAWTAIGMAEKVLRELGEPLPDD